MIITDFVLINDNTMNNRKRNEVTHELLGGLPAIALLVISLQSTHTRYLLLLYNPLNHGIMCKYVYFQV